ncbi:MAG: hypothetical protein V4467_03310 [Patescibacteria group bacterium]
MKQKKNVKNYRFANDISIILLSAVVAYGLVRSGVVSHFLSATEGYKVIGSFIAGIFFTSAFTIAPASVALAGLAASGPMFVVAFWGALGAVFGDLLLFFFIRDVFADDLIKVLRKFWRKHFFASFHLGFLKWLLPVLGGIIIASPLPDELGLALMGVSKTRLIFLIPISFVFNFFGILLLAMIVRTV